MIAIALKNGILVILLILTIHFLIKRYLLENRTIVYKEVDNVMPFATPPIYIDPLTNTPPVIVADTKTNLMEDEIFSHLFPSTGQTPQPIATVPVLPPPEVKSSFKSDNKYHVVGDPAQKIEGFADLSAFDSFDGNYQEI